MEAEYRSVWSHLMQVPFTQGYVDVAGLRTRYVHAGPRDAPALILIHGTAGHWEAFSANLGAYAANFSTYAFDMVGAGFTEKPDRDYDLPDLVEFVRNFMGAFGIERASLAGVSLGAWTAVRFALTHPAMTERLVLVSPVGLQRLSPASGNSEEETSKRLAIVNDTSWDNTRKIFRGLIHDDRNVIPDLVKIRQTVHRLPNAAADMAHVFSIAQPDVYARGALSDDQLRSIEAPALIFVSEHDNPFFRIAAAAMAELMPHATLIELSNVAHWAQFETPDYFNRVTLAFLQGWEIAALAEVAHA